MRLIELERGGTRVQIAPEHGGRLAQITIRPDERWLELLWPPSGQKKPDDPLAWGSYAMLPWPNRIANGCFSVTGMRVESMPGAHILPTGHAIHGFGFTRAWIVEQQTPERCAMSLDLAGLWPLGGRARQRVDVLDDGVEMTIELESTGEPFPAGAGWHPWFRRDVIAGTDAHVQLSATSRYEQASDCIPTGALLDLDEGYDLRDGPPVGDRRIDACYPTVEDPIVIRWGELALTMRSSANITHAVVYTPAHAVCVEPQTCCNDGFNLAARGVAGTGVALVEPSRPLIASTRWTWRSL